MVKLKNLVRLYSVRGDCGYVLKVFSFLSKITGEQMSYKKQMLYPRGPQPLDHRPVVVFTLLGMGPHSSR